MARKNEIPHWARKHLRGTIDEWDVDGWRCALRDEDPDGAYRAFTRLVSLGCHRRELATHLMVAQRSLTGRPIGRAEAAKALKRIRAARETIDTLEKSSLRFAIRLDDIRGPRTGLQWMWFDLKSLEVLLETALPRVHGHRNLALEVALGAIGRYVAHSTGRPRVELLSALLPTILGDMTFDYASRRKRQVTAAK